jgi:hypothetical protein
MGEANAQGQEAQAAISDGTHSADFSLIEILNLTDTG